MKRFKTPQMVFSALFVAFGIILPSIFHSMGLMGSIFLPMHLPVLSSVLTGMPPLYPVAIFMAVELGVYGSLSGLLYKRYNSLVSLVGAMIGGRIALGIAQVILIGASGGAFVFQVFLTSAFITGLPGIVLQLITIPSIILLLKKSRVLERVEMSL